MNIVIAGAGDVGFHLAELLLQEDHDITLIDGSEEVLQMASTQLDVRTVLGDSSSHQTLKQAEVNKASLFIAVATSHSTNILSCLIAKKLGAKKTIARSNHTEFLQEANLEHLASLGVDEIFSPRHLAVKEIMRLLHRITATDFYDFDEGKISVLGFTIDDDSVLIGRPFSALNDEATDYHVKVVCVLRDDTTIIVKSNERIKKGDHIYLATDKDGLNLVNKYIGKSLRRIDKVMLIGGSNLALETALALEGNRELKIILNSEEKCKQFASKLSNDTLILRGDPNDSNILIEEGLEQMDAFIALTPNSESNILASLMAEKEGVYKTIALVDNVAYTHISQNIGIDTIINQKILAANEIFRHVRKGTIMDLATLHGVEGEIIEFTINKSNQLTKKPICELKLPEQAVVAGIIRNNIGIIPKHDFVLQQDDHVVIYALPESVKSLEKIFR